MRSRLSSPSRVACPDAPANNLVPPVMVMSSWTSSGPSGLTIAVPTMVPTAVPQSSSTRTRRSVAAARRQTRRNTDAGTGFATFGLVCTSVVSTSLSTVAKQSGSPRHEVEGSATGPPNRKLVGSLGVELEDGGGVPTVASDLIDLIAGADHTSPAATAAVLRIASGVCGRSVPRPNRFPLDRRNGNTVGPQRYRSRGEGRGKVRGLGRPKNHPYLHSVRRQRRRSGLPVETDFRRRVPRLRGKPRAILGSAGRMFSARCREWITTFCRGNTSCSGSLARHSTVVKGPGRSSRRRAARSTRIGSVHRGSIRPCPSRRTPACSFFARARELARALSPTTCRWARGHRGSVSSGEEEADAGGDIQYDPDDFLTSDGWKSWMFTGTPLLPSLAAARRRGSSAGPGRGGSG